MQQEPPPFQITPELVLRAYAAGIFPMAESRDNPQLHWIDPETRGILLLDAFHVSRSLMKVLRREVFKIRCDTAFEAVLRGCAAPTPKRRDTWINSEIHSLFTELFRQGHAHSVETWRDGRLVGGLYGVSIGAAFFGESMFSQESDASKVALCHLVARLRRGGFLLLDTQFTTAHLSRFGAIEISRQEYLERLEQATRQCAVFEAGLGGVPVTTLLRHSINQTS
ncbi:MAG: leucyl/phenylalanyl-tRNA--protein transferase [Alphaproteobacteria bacterium]|nr:leucyl/phenylalanyl-tRNA--protein transferase [Alphaproteobacteria bacterium]